MEQPLVSICCITYNHGKYIRECMEGFLMQDTSFDFEILIHDDASRDNTPAIIKEYVQKYPDVVKPIYQSENQFSKGYAGKINALFNFPRARGKYIAMCEGDDYWTDPLKLQKQVDFLEAHPEFSLTCGGYINKHLDIEEELIIKNPKLYPNNNQVGFEFSLEDLHKDWLTKTLTTLFRKDAFQIEELNKYRYSRDVHLFYHIMKNGKGAYFQEILGVYNIHEGGVHSMIAAQSNKNSAYLLHKELYLVNKDSYSKKMLFRKILKKLKFDLENPYPQNTVRSRSRLLHESLLLVSTGVELVSFFKHFMFYCFCSLSSLLKNH